MRLLDCAALTGPAPVVADLTRHGAALPVAASNLPLRARRLDRSSRRKALAAFALVVLALLPLTATSLMAQVRIVRPTPVEGLGIVQAPGVLSSGSSPADTVATFAPYLSTVSFLPRYLSFEGEGRPAPSENLALDAFLEGERRRQQADEWQRAKLARLLGEEGAGEDLERGLGGALRVPERIASLFGGTAALDVNGRLRISFGGGTTKLEPDLRPPGFPRSDLNLDLDQLLELDIRGTIGRKVNLAVDFNSEREFQNKNVLSAFYAGDEDEILKRIDLGDINVTLPPSRFINVGATRGNFGLQGVGQLGPLSFRGMAARKEGETAERRLTITPRTQGVVETVSVELKDTQYQDSRHFLLFHPDSLASRRIAFPNQGTTLANPGSLPESQSLTIWRDNGNPTDDIATNAKFGTAFVNPVDRSVRPEEAQQGFFNLLIEGQDYFAIDNLVVTTDRPLNANEKLAVSYVTVVGDTIGSPQSADTLELKLVKPVNPDSLDFTFDYTLRNVYPLRGTEVLLQDLQVFRGDRQLRVDIERVNGQDLKFSQILGVVDQSERPLNQFVGKDPFGGPDFLVFPDLKPFLQPAPFPPDVVNLEVPNRRLYTVPPEQRQSATQDQVYFINATYRGKAGQTNEVDLGALNILEGSETITIGGTPLVRGKDYQIFYDLGRLVFSEPEALFSRFPNSQVEIGFEVAPLFNLAPTSVAGFNAVYQQGEKLFLNSSVLMQTTESLSNRPILGAEPTRSVLAEMDGNYETELPFLTRAIEGISFLRSEGPASFRLRGEAALNLPNPNTDGRVFLNDFEGIELANSISLNNRTYLFGSVPEQTGFDLLSAREIEFNTRAVPLDQVTTDQLVGNRAVVEVMTVDVRNPVFPGVIAENSWRSITHRISVQGADISRQESLDFFVNGEQGKILVDLGTVGEDGVRFNRSSEPVGAARLDSEDLNRDNQLDANEDVGLDATPGDDSAPPPGDDGNDDFNASFNPQGTEQNDVLDTEDLNVNGVLDRRDDVIRWEVDLGSQEFVVPGSENENGFRQIRLPLQRPDEVVGSPDLRRVQAVRLTFFDFGPDFGGGATDVALAQLEVVGSTFLERGIVDSLGNVLAGDRSDSLTISQVNTLENPDYFSPPGVVAQQERADEIIRTGLQPLKEQSLVLSYRDLPQGAEGRIYQPLNDRENYLDYERMQIFVNGQVQRGIGGQPVSSARLPTFFVEFGADTLNVYRYQAPLLFNTWEEHAIEFSEFTRLKAELLRRLADAGELTGEITSEDGRYRVVLRDERTPQPTLSQVSQLTIGVENDLEQEISEGSFWVDEWRLTEPVTEPGGAQYVAATTRLGDVLSLDVQLENREARFRDLSAQMNNQTSRDFDVRTTFRLDRLLPAALGLDLPLTLDHFTTSDQPLFLVGSDLEVEESAELRERQRIDNVQTVATLSLRRSQRSRNPLVRATLDRLDARFTLRGQKFESLDADRENDAWDLTVRYDTDFARKPIPLPFEVLGALPLPDFIKESKAFRSFVNLDINPLPSRLSLVSTSLNGETSLLRRQGLFNPFSDVTNGFPPDSLDPDSLGADSLRQVNLFTADSTRTTSGDVTLVLQPTNSLRVNYTLSSTRDMNFPDPEDVDLGDSPLPGVEALRTQRFDFQWSPPVTDWLVPRYNYNASYGSNHTREVSQVLQGKNLRDFTGQVAKGWTVEINLPVLLDRASGAEPRPGAPGVPAQPTPADSAEGVRPTPLDSLDRLRPEPADSLGAVRPLAPDTLAGVAAARADSLAAEAGAPDPLEPVRRDTLGVAAGRSSGQGARQGFRIQDILQPIRFESSKRQTSTFRQVPEDPSLRYTFGLKDPGDDDFPADAQNLSEVDRLRVATGLSPLPNLLLQSEYQRNDNQRVFFGGENEQVQIIWPDVSLRWSLRSLPGFLGVVLQRLDLSSDYQTERGHTTAKGIRLSEYDRGRWGPLVAVEAQWAGGLITHFRATSSDNDITALRSLGEGEEEEVDNVRTESADEMELTINYLFRPGSRVFLPLPFLMGDRIKGPLRTSLTVARRLREDLTRSAGGAEVEQAGLFNARTTTTEIRPALSYDLSRLSSGIAFSYLLRDDQKRDVATTTYSLELFVDLIF